MANDKAKEDCAITKDYQNNKVESIISLLIFVIKSQNEYYDTKSSLES